MFHRLGQIDSDELRVRIGACRLDYAGNWKSANLVDAVDDGNTFTGNRERRCDSTLQPFVLDRPF